MATQQSLDITPMTQEVRLATTMTGGVSLAIWMAGVAREINLLAQASQWRRVGGDFPPDSTLPPPAEKSLKLYRKLIDLLDIVVDVDILSGTSAGGINAALLASSRVRGSDLGDLRKIWLKLGALSDLIRDPTDKVVPSLLYGDKRMFSDLNNEIPHLKSGPFPPATYEKQLGCPSTTLYVTTTLINGETSQFTDSFGTRVQDVDRRGVFTFTEAHLADKDKFPALALAARSSASFPAAFEPSFVPFTKGTPATKDVPARPPMADYIGITRSHWVADGGLLDNQPIDVLLQRIFDRPAERPVRRVLLFVVPSSGPQGVQKSDPDEVEKPLGLVEGLMKDLTAVTTQSIAADLRTIRNHQDRMEARTDARLRLAELANELSGSRLLTRNLLEDYQNREASKQAQTITDALLRRLSTWDPKSGSAAESIPEDWRRRLGIGGDAEKVCRQNIKGAILQRWSRRRPSDHSLLLPESVADLYRYGQMAFDLAKGSALEVVGAAYQLAQDSDFDTLSLLTMGIHNADKPRAAADQLAPERRPMPWPMDLTDIVRSVCTAGDKAGEALGQAAAEIAGKYLDACELPDAAWSELEAVFERHWNTLTGLAEARTDAKADRLHPTSRPSRDSAAVKELSTYLEYLRPPNEPSQIALKLFDLAATQRAMLPAGADIEQPLQLIQVSSDTRTLLAPSFSKAAEKLTGMQLHHFGAFYKCSWRANDWMWGRLDGAGWLVHMLLDPTRMSRVVQRNANQLTAPGAKAKWFLDQLKTFGAPAIPEGGYHLPSDGQASGPLTEQTLLNELKFLDDSSAGIPASVPNTSLWLSQVWQQRVLDEELDVLASTILDRQPGQQQPDWSPTETRTWARYVKEAVSPEDKYALLKTNPVPCETFITDKGSPLMARTITKAAATASAAIGSISDIPSVVKPPLATLRTLTLSGYRVTSTTKGVARRTIIAGAALLILGVALAMQSVTVFGYTGLATAGIGAYLVVLSTWQWSSRLLFALLSITIVGAVLSMATPLVRNWLFGTEGQDGLLARHVYWLGTQWWYPLAAVGVLVVAVAALGAANPRRK
jgi:patatin-related protein